MPDPIQRELELLLRDSMSHVLQQVGAELESVKKKAADFGGVASSGLDAALNQTSRLEGNATKTAASFASMSEGLSKLGKDLVAPLGLAAGFVAATKSLEQLAVDTLQLRNFSINTGFAVSEIDAMSEAAQRAGAATGESNAAAEKLGAAYKDLVAKRTHSPIFERIMAMGDADLANALLYEAEVGTALGFRNRLFKAWLDAPPNSDRRARLEEISNLSKSDFEAQTKRIGSSMRRYRLSLDRAIELNRKWVNATIKLMNIRNRILNSIGGFLIDTESYVKRMRELRPVPWDTVTTQARSDAQDVVNAFSAAFDQGMNILRGFDVPPISGVKAAPILPRPALSQGGFGPDAYRGAYRSTIMRLWGQYPPAMVYGPGTGYDNYAYPKGDRLPTSFAARWGGGLTPFERTPFADRFGGGMPQVTRGSAYTSDSYSGGFAYPPTFAQRFGGGMPQVSRGSAYTSGSYAGGYGYPAGFSDRFGFGTSFADRFGGGMPQVSRGSMFATGSYAGGYGYAYPKSDRLPTSFAQRWGGGLTSFARTPFADRFGGGMQQMHRGSMFTPGSYAGGYGYKPDVDTFAQRFGGGMTQLSRGSMFAPGSYAGGYAQPQQQGLIGRLWHSIVETVEKSNKSLIDIHDSLVRMSMGTSDGGGAGPTFRRNIGPGSTGGRGHQPPSGTTYAGGDTPSPSGEGGVLYDPVTGTSLGGGLGANRGSHVHGGDDIEAKHGSPIYAIRNGTIVSHNPRGTYQGDAATRIVWDDGTSSYYMHHHLNPDLAERLKRGEKVTIQGGQTLGTSGTAAGVPHLHFEMFDKNGRRISPRQYFGWDREHLPQGGHSARTSPKQLQPGPATMAPGGGTPDDTGVGAGLTGNDFLKARRASRIAEIENNPKLKDELHRLIWAEARGSGHLGQVAVVETLINRSSMIGNTIDEEMHSGFYGPIKYGNLPRSISDTDHERFQKAIDATASGSDVTVSRTDQGSGNDPNVGGPGKVRIPGSRETINFWKGFRRGRYFSHDDSRRFAEEQERQIREGGDQPKIILSTYADVDRKNEADRNAIDASLTRKAAQASSDNAPKVKASIKFLNVPMGAGIKTKADATGDAISKLEVIKSKGSESTFAKVDRQSSFAERFAPAGASFAERFSVGAH